MKSLGQLLHAAQLSNDISNSDEIVTLLCTHSKKCKEGSIFFAFKGQSSDGSAYVTEALQNGALVAIVDSTAQVSEDKRIIHVANPHKTFALMNAAWFDYPQTSLRLIAVTGTDGKSSTAEILHQLLTKEGIPTALFATTAIDDGTGKVPSPYRVSTPEADILYAFLDRCRSNSVRYVIIEATSHGLSETYSRLYNLSFEIGIITTLSGDHLEFHQSREEYLQAKLALLPMITKYFISSVENQELARCLEHLKPPQKAIVLGRDYSYSVQAGKTFTIEGEFERHRFTMQYVLPVFGTNALLALLASSVVTKKDPKELLCHLPTLQPIHGRMQKVPNSKGVTIFIDYAHTIGAYEMLFTFINQIKKNHKVITVMGAAGGRDKEKRAILGSIAAHVSDILILTEEDPVFEELGAINAMIKTGITSKTCTVLEIDDRRAAIAEAGAHAEKGDFILLLGKGHERSIQRRDQSIPWNEEETVYEEIP